MRGRDHGFAMLWSVALAGVLVSVGSAGLCLCALVMSHARVGNAADLAAIAAASNPIDPCAFARRIAAAHSSELLDCHVDAHLGDVTVRVGVEAPPLARWLVSERLEASARAGR